MDKKTIDFLTQHGYKTVSTDNIKDFLVQGYVKSLHIEIKLAEPSMLLARVKEENAIIEYDKMDDKSPEYLTIMQSDTFNTILFSIPVDSIKNMIVQANNSMTDIVFDLSTDNNSYRITLEKLKDIY